MANAVEMMDKVIQALSTIRVGKIIDEYALQSRMAKAFDQAGIAYEKERQLGRGSRVDFLASGGIAVEAKKGKPNRTRLEQQISRYAEFGEVKAVVIVVETSLGIPIRSARNGKPCTVMGLQKLWGIAL